MEISSYRLPLAFALFALSIAHVGAAPLADTLDFALHFSRLKAELSDTQQAIDITAKHVGITSFDRGEGMLQPGLALGYAYIGTSNQPLTAGMELEGFYISPALRSVAIDTPRFTLTLTGAYLYQRVKDSNATQAVTLEWYQPQLDVDALWRITHQVGLIVGGQYGRIDADEKISGAVNQTVTLKKRSTLGSHAGLEFDLGGDGQVGFQLHHAIGDGVEIYFQRQF